MTEMSQGEQCRVHVANIRTMCSEVEELLTIGALRGFGQALRRLRTAAECMELAVSEAADAAGAVSADSPEGVAAELAAQDKRERARVAAEAAANFDAKAFRADLFRRIGQLPPEEAREQRREQRREWGRKGARVAAEKRRAAALAEGEEG